MAYHVNPETGDTNKCDAKNKCPFGGESGVDNHFDKKSDAKAFAEKLMNEKHEVVSTTKNTSTDSKTSLKGLRSKKNSPERRKVLHVISLRSEQYKSDMKKEIDDWSNNAQKASRSGSRISPNLANYDATVKDIHSRVNSWADVETRFAHSAV